MHIALLASLCLALSVQAQTQTNQPTRPISMQEAIRLALENNYDIALERYEPRLAAYAISESYAVYYDPTFTISAVHTESTTEGAFDPQTGLRLAGQETEIDSINGTAPVLQGLLPTGLRYSIFADYDQQSGRGPARIGEIDRPSTSPLPDTDIFGFEDSDRYSGEVSIRLEQPLLRDFWIDNGRRQIKLLKKDLQISEYRLLYVVMDIVRQVQASYYNLIGAREIVKARQKGVELAQRLLSENRKRIEVGTMAPLDEKQAESEAALRRAELIESEREVTFQENVLKNLISNQYQQWHAVTLVPTETLLAMPQTYDIQESWLTALDSRPDYKEVKIALEREDVEVRYHFNQLFPFLNLVGTYGRRGFDELLYTNQVQAILPDGSRVSRRVPARDASWSRMLNDIREEEAPFHSFGAVLSFPLTFARERSNYKAAKERQERAKVTVQQLHQGILVGIDDAIKEAQSAYESVQATRNAREFAEVALDAEQKKLDNGRSTSFNVLQLQEDTTDRRSLEIAALARYNTALSALHFLEGRILEKNGVKLELKK